VSGREAMSAEILAYETGVADGSRTSGKRYPSRYITVKYQLLAKTPEAFRTAYNQLASILNVEDAELIFNDERDKFYIGTPEEIGEPEGGTNNVVSEFTIFCADPFKYSIAEYEVEPELTDNSFLLDYKGTYKAFPTLEAKFHSENEGIAALTGNGDCGYVAFFNENEKIIQLGDPEETDTETYDKSQTLTLQNFDTETAWNNIAETNWATNKAKLTSSDFIQSGSVAMAVASYTKTTAPSTSGELLTKRSTADKPYIDYSVSAKTSDRKADRITVKVTVTAALEGSGTGTTATITAGAKVTLNNTNLYASSDTNSSSGKRTGTYYLWDASTKNGRIRITNSASNVGRSGQVTGWVKMSDINLSSGGGVLGTGYGLKCGVQISGGDWYYATLKDENTKWSGNGKHTVTLNVLVKNIDATTTVLEDIKFKVERTDDNESEVGIIDETLCNDLEISTYTADVPETWYLMPQTYGSSSTKIHGPSITRAIPADASGATGSQNWSFSWKQKMSIGSSSSATKEYGVFQALLLSGSGSSRNIVAGVNIYKNTPGNKASLRFIVNGKTMQTVEIDMSYHNKYFGNNSASKGITTVKTSSIIKEGNKISFNIGGIQKTFTDANVATVEATEISFYFGQYNTSPSLACNGIYWAKFVKNNCDTYADIPNKFSANDIVTADCKSGDIFLNNRPAPSLGAMGNDWEDFYLTPGLNQIGFAYSDWVNAAYAPKFKIRYREVFI
jgi:predicted phage tail component-like protein